jgi:hypothetical protein
MHSNFPSLTFGQAAKTHTGLSMLTKVDYTAAAGSNKRTITANQS